MIVTGPFCAAAPPHVPLPAAETAGPARPADAAEATGPAAGFPPPPPPQPVWIEPLPLDPFAGREEAAQAAYSAAHRILTAGDEG